MSGQRTIKFFIEQREITCSIEGYLRETSQECLVQADNNLLAGTRYNTAGFGVEKLLSIDQFAELKGQITALVKEKLKMFTSQELSGFTLEKYHTFVTDEEHLAFVNSIKMCIDIAEFPIDETLITDKMGTLLQKKLSFTCRGLENRKFFCLRFVRPSKNQDCNPPHKDVYIDRLRNAVNMYVPLSGSTSESSLSLLPGSHRWLESDCEVTENNSTVDGTTFSVPVICSTKTDYVLQRPNPAYGEVLLFSPYAIHGAGYNFSTDTTRVSLEMRLWPADD
jgi:hypothetical protein